MSAHVEHVTCQQLVAALTDYLEGTVDPQRRIEIERHIVLCRACAAYVDQMRHTIELVGRLAEDEPDSEQSTEFLELFRRWQAQREPNP